MKPKKKTPTPEEVKAVVEVFKKLPPETRILYTGIGLGLAHRAGMRDGKQPRNKVIA